MTSPLRDADLYGKEYYDHYLGPVPYDREEPSWRSHFGSMARHIVDRFAPKRVLDVGCAKGFLVEHLRDLGVEAYGTDVSPYAISEAREDIRAFCRVASATDPVGERFDLVTCIEVAEHLAPEDAPRLVESLCAAADEILFSSTPDDFKELTHRNVQPASYWRSLFAAAGFYPNLHFEPGFIAPHAIQFRRLRRVPIRVAVFSREKADHAVVRLRLLDPLRELEKAGRAKVSLVSTHSRTIDVEALLAADVFVVHREFADRRTSTEVLEAARALGKPVVFEIDDLLHQVPHTNPASAGCAPITGDLFSMYRDADFVTASTERLREEIERAEPAARGKTFVARNCLNPEIWGGEEREPAPRGEEPLVVGWVGSPTHADDLALVEDAVRYLVRKHEGRVVFRFWGFLPPSLADVEGVGLVRGLVPDLSRHAREMRGQRIDLAIAPLRDHAFNEAKSDVKWLEYSICGIPTICSDVAPYAAAIVHGSTGWLVENTTAAWVEAIERLLGDEEMRTAIARNAFREVRSGACVDVAASQWDDLYGAFAVSGPREGGRAEGPAEDGAAAKAAAALFRLQAKIQRSAGDVEASAASLEASIALSPDQADLLAETAAAWLGQGHLSAARTILEATTRHAPRTAKAHLFLSRLYRALEDPVRAETALRAGTEANPEDRKLLRDLVDLLRESGRESEIRAAIGPYLGKERSFDELVADAQFLAGMERPEEAIALLEEGRPADSGSVDFGPLVQAIQTVRDARPSNGRAATGTNGTDARAPSPRPIVAAVYTSEPLHGSRVQRRLGGPLRALERAGALAIRWSDGEVNRRAHEGADLVVLHAPLLGTRSAEPVLEGVRRRGTKLVLEIDDPGDLAADRLEALRRILRETEAVTVPTAGLRASLTERIPEVADRIHVLETGIDLEIWPGRSPQRSDPRGFLTLALFPTPGSAPALRHLVQALAPAIARNPRIRLTTWVSDPAPGLVPPGSRSVVRTSPIHREHANRLQAAAIDLALLPVSPETAPLADALRLELAASRIPTILACGDASSRAEAARGADALLPEDPAHWAEAIEALLDDLRRRGEIADRAWARAMRLRTVQLNAPRWAELYGRLVQEPREAALAVP